jgi:hypothetical protein
MGINSLTEEKDTRKSQYKKEYYLKNKDKISTKNAKYYETHRQEIIESAKKYQEQNVEKIKCYQTSYRQQNRDKLSEKNKEYRKRNLERIHTVATDYRRRYSKKIHEYYGQSCYICGVSESCYRMYDCHHVDPAEKDFVVATLISRDWDTIVVPELQKCVYVCANCHRKLHDGWFDEDLRSGKLTLIPGRRGEMNFYGKEEKVIQYRKGDKLRERILIPLYESDKAWPNEKKQQELIAEGLKPTRWVVSSDTEVDDFEGLSKFKENLPDNCATDFSLEDELNWIKKHRS